MKVKEKDRRRGQDRKKLLTDQRQKLLPEQSTPDSRNLDRIIVTVTKTRLVKAIRNSECVGTRSLLEKGRKRI